MISKDSNKPLSDLDDMWVNLPSPSSEGPKDLTPTESMQDRVRRVNVDIRDLQKFYNISIASRHHSRMQEYYADELDDLFAVKFDKLHNQDKADFILLRNHFKRQNRQLELDWESKDKILPALPFADIVIAISEARQDVKPLDAEKTAAKLDEVARIIADIKRKVQKGKVTMAKENGFRALKVIAELRAALKSVDTFYRGYKPMYDWWVAKTYDAVEQAFDEYVPVVKEYLAGQHPDKKDEIVGKPIGREAIMVELAAEMIAYTPEELIKLANTQYDWAQKEMKAAAKELGYGDDWKKGLEHTKNDCVPPGEQEALVAKLAEESETFVKKHNLVTVPRIPGETHTLLMMSPEEQKTTPFLTGGWDTRVSYPVASMSQEMKRMVTRGNSRGLTHAVVFHEYIPGHRLQLSTSERVNSHRWLFMNPFVVEGWGMYWEMYLWNRGDWFKTPEEKIGTLFWRMHRAARIIYTLKFHLGEIDPEDIVDRLVDWVGHERSTAESEVRRWFNGDWAPLYQCGYMLGALQLISLRQEALDTGKYTEKQFNDSVLRNCFMPIELMRALILGQELDPEQKAKWRFYD